MYKNQILQSISYSLIKTIRGNRLCTVVNMLDCDIIVNEFKLQLCYCIDFQTNSSWKGMNPLILWVKLYKDGFGIK